MRCHNGKKFAGKVLSNLFKEDPAFVYLDTRDHSPPREAELFLHWSQVVQDYFRRSLSNPGDIFVALGPLRWSLRLEIELL